MQVDMHRIPSWIRKNKNTGMPCSFHALAWLNRNRTISENDLESPELGDSFPVASSYKDGMGWLSCSAEKIREYVKIRIMIPENTKLA